ncbi:hypothetical protein [Bacteriophage sp.]|nr:hypothetical protein [Bacteriophage sp.]UOF80110.1 hypothetical protein [Bacteriophage sp.]
MCHTCARSTCVWRRSISGEVHGWVLSDPLVHGRVSEGEALKHFLLCSARR